MGGERDPGETPESQQRGRHISLVDLLNAAITTRLIAKYSAITWFARQIDYLDLSRNKVEEHSMKVRRYRD